MLFFFQAEDGIRDLVRSRGLGDVYKRQVRDYVTSVIYDIVSRYDVDGIHADDYFYPYPPNQITNQDAQTFANYPRGFSNLADWRRDNVNLLIAQVNDTIQSVKPHVKSVSYTHLTLPTSDLV